MSNNIQETLDTLEKFDGFRAAAIAHGDSGMALGFAGGDKSFDVEIAVAANCQVVKAKNKAMNALKIKGGIEDILITLQDQYHIIRPYHKNPVIFIYLVVDKERSNSHWLAFSSLNLRRISRFKAMLAIWK